ncbi:MAG: transposase, partial [Acidobacteriota bacterium]
MSRQDSTTQQEVVGFRRDIRSLLQDRLTEAVETVLEVELAEVLGTAWYERIRHRRGYRNGSTHRRITTEAGLRAIAVPRARIRRADGTTGEFHSRILPQYARRTRAIDEVILATYLAGANSRRIRKALGPWLGEANLSKSSVSRIVVRLKQLFEQWRGRDLTQERYGVVFLDGFHLKVRLARRVVSVPVLAALGVGHDGQKVLLALQMATSESSSQWGDVLKDLNRRGLAAPLLIVVDGGPGLNKAVAGWPDVKVQRCTVH